MSDLLVAHTHTEIARAEAAARERRRLARIARDERTCSSTEKRTVRDGAGTPPGCASYYADFMAEQAAGAAPDEQGGG